MQAWALLFKLLNLPMQLLLQLLLLHVTSRHGMLVLNWVMLASPLVVTTPMQAASTPLLHKTLTNMYGQLVRPISSTALQLAVATYKAVAITTQVQLLVQPALTTLQLQAEPLKTLTMLTITPYGVSAQVIPCLKA